MKHAALLLTIIVLACASCANPNTGKVDAYYTIQEILKWEPEGLFTADRLFNGIAISISKGDSGVLAKLQAKYHRIRKITKDGIATFKASNEFVQLMKTPEGRLKARGKILNLIGPLLDFVFGLIAETRNTQPAPITRHELQLQFLPKILCRPS